MARKWTPEERQKQADAIRRWQPWEGSTGPKTAQGKERSKNNALKHGMRSAEGEALMKLFTAQRQFVSSLKNLPLEGEGCGGLARNEPSHSWVGVPDAEE